jgi:Mg/Co/Ni transporter MgtE
MAPKSATKDNASAVLNELKETIKRQQAEIASLKKKKAPPASHGHGGDVDISEEELDSYLTKPFFSLAMQRIGWLALFLASLSLTAIIMNGFEHTLSRQIELAYFVPLLAGHGGNTGGQSVGTVLSALSAGSIHVKDAPKVIGKEAMSGLVMGTILGIVVGPIAHYGMGISEPVATVIALTLPFVSAIAAFLGSAIPFTAIWLHLDPSVISGPAMTSFVDVCGLMSYFLIANSIFNMFGLEL